MGLTQSVSVRAVEDAFSSFSVDGSTVLRGEACRAFVRQQLESQLQVPVSRSDTMAAVLLSKYAQKDAQTHVLSLSVALDRWFEAAQFVVGTLEEEQEHEGKQETQEEEKEDDDEEEDEERLIALVLNNDFDTQTAAPGDDTQFFMHMNALVHHFCPAVSAWPKSSQSLLLPLIVQSAALARAGIASELEPNAWYLMNSGLRVSPLWREKLQQLPSCQNVQKTVEFFSANNFDAPVPHGCLDPVAPLERVVVEKVFASGHAPKLIRIFPANRLVIFKKDDLRTDFGVTSCFAFFNSLWRLSGNTAYCITFAVTPITHECGFLEFVPNSTPLSEWNVDRLVSMSSKQLDSFIRSAAGSFVASHVLGVRDRHRDNLMIANDCELWQCDFMHVFNRRTKMIDAPRMPILRAMRSALISRGRWDGFKHSLCQAFVVLRRHATLLIQLARGVFRSVVADDVIEREMSRTLFLGRAEQEAVAAFLSEVEMSVFSFRKFLKNQAHSFNMERMKSKSDVTDNNNNSNNNNNNNNHNSGSGTDSNRVSK